MALELDSYLASGSNILKVLEYRVNEMKFGINILKVSRIIDVPKSMLTVPEAHPSVVGIIEDHKRVIPIVSLARFFSLPENPDEIRLGRILLTEFFGRVNGFLVSSVSNVHTITWDKVRESEEVLGGFKNEYVIAIARPTPEHNIWLLDYERIIMELSPRVAEEERAKFGHAISGAGRKILVAEDSAAVRNMLTVELEKMGFDITATRDGVEAWEAFEKDPSISLVVSDVEMPKMDGLALLKRIKDTRPATGVIVYSSIGDIGMKSRAEFLKADAHVTKLNIEELMAKIAEISRR